jgi:Uma2 family endonuclease
MAGPVKVDEYFRGLESVRPQELVFGVVREPPAPRYGHQSVVTRVVVLLDRHVRERRLGEICVAPVDVVLDRERALVVQPDVVFVAAARRDIIRDRVWGAPDLVVEVLSDATEARDRGEKLSWYRRYGVRECWLVDAEADRIEIVDCAGDARRKSRVFQGPAPVESAVLGRLGQPAAAFFAREWEKWE